MKKIIIATKNKGKAKEFKALFAAYGLEAISLNELDNIPDIEETGTTFKENAALKAEQIASLLSLPVIADDSGLMIDALDGRPGVYSARYAGEHKSDEANINKVLAELQSVPEEERTARFICVLAVAIPNSVTTYYTGYCHGKIAKAAVGNYGFGYDPIFIPDGYEQTMAQLTAGEKNVISHRWNAIKQLETNLKKQDLFLDNR
ncbi:MULTISPECIES: XTP/dITP diphosphatase [Clostridia]|uniref:XTP/dITP diphosphatase n=1 Tax=Clostridia TaxID=186801 RepID=UPI000EA202AD|nr:MULTISPECIES: XTP/dITP diphosphatase [Clostridia]NBJ68697.1 XTP/dITP diphosphatase [Roseburia sp. 1XD42-34]RKI80630.1 XTP/dITP diphosphatase [Clostridium sp. 1xD42-85]